MYLHLLSKIQCKKWDDNLVSPLFTSSIVQYHADWCCAFRKFRLREVFVLQLLVFVCCRPVTFSETQRLAPEEVFDPGHEKQKSEMTQEERKALRSATKKRRKMKIVGKVVRQALLGVACGRKLI